MWKKQADVLCRTKVLLLIFGVLCGSGCTQNPDYSADRERISEEISGELIKKMNVWYPKVIDDQSGGYLSNFSYNWKQEGNQDKMIVTQARHLWSLSKIGTKYPDDQRYEEYAAHGFEFLTEKMWDHEYGGFYQMVTREGAAIANSEDGETITKTLYGNAFALYGLAAYYGFSNDTAALEAAKQTFNWLDTHAYDSVHGGYYQPLARDGTPDTTGYPKDYNSGIHILEALTELYMVWPDDTVRDRLNEMFQIVRDTMVTDKGYLTLYFDASWAHFSCRDSTEAVIRENISRDHVTPGHDIETAFLLLEAAHALGLEEDPETMQIAKKMVDHTLETGWEPEAGGVYEMGYYFEDDELTITREDKNWWGQAEALNSLLIMANIYPGDPHNYFEKFVRQWEYINEYLIDHEHGGWYDYGLDKTPGSRMSRKSQIWKGNYHTVRSLIGCLKELENE
ncbi:MAG: AGE family epimerase/isomerase [Balneolaceae bacterium]